jgi:acyl-CoA reductase-like NAD-dependent aldehyde dehydrogenase
VDRDLMTATTIGNWIAGVERPADSGAWLDKINPHSGELMSRFAASDAGDVGRAVAAAEAAFPEWSATTPVARGRLLGAWTRLMRERQDDLARIVAEEAGKPARDAVGEVAGSIAQGEFFAGEGLRLYARSLTSGMPGKYSHTVRQPRGIAGLIVPANTPIANIAWKVFPALVCGNTAVLKSAEDAPRIALAMARLAREAGIPNGVLNVVHGAGDPAGRALVRDARVAVVSFTGSTAVGRWIAEVCGARLARVSLELGGKNPFVVCDDADQALAIEWAVQSAFSNAGQRCASGSRILVFESIYDDFVKGLVDRAHKLVLGVGPECDFGPVINQRQHRGILAAIERARAQGARILCGGSMPSNPELAGGFYVEPTLIDGLPVDDALCQVETFGPVATLHRVRDLAHALEVANGTEYGLTAAIHTRNVDRAMWFAQRARAGVVNVNIGTFGSEPHMPFGGFGASGNGTREPGVEALDVYSELKNISFLVRPNLT